jgi:hypothetical protein
MMCSQQCRCPIEDIPPSGTLWKQKRKEILPVDLIAARVGVNSLKQIDCDCLAHIWLALGKQPLNDLCHPRKYLKPLSLWKIPQVRSKFAQEHV